MLRFQHAQSRQSLAEGLAEYYAAFPGLKRGDALSPEARAFFRSHDTVHVVYGCGISMPDEAVVKLASIFGTTGGLRVLKGYALHESIDIYRKLPLRSTLVAILAAPFLCARTLWHCTRQRAKWPWAQHERFEAMALGQLRAEFDIRAAHATAAVA